MAHLIRSGCDLAARNNEGNTPLHCLVQQAALACDDDKRLEPHLKIWQTVIDGVLDWWCKSGTGPTRPPKISTKLYRQCKRDALYYLRSELRNDQGLSVIQYAVQEGVSDLVREMIWVEDIFVWPEDVQNRNEPECCSGCSCCLCCCNEQEGKSDRVTILVTNLMPHVREDKVRCWKAKHTWGPFENEEGGRSLHTRKKKLEKLVKEHWDPFFCKNDKTLLEPFLRTKPPTKAAKVMNIQPLKQLIREHWFIRQWYTVVIMIAHLVHMVFYTNYCADITFAAFKPNISGQASVDPNFCYLIWPIAMVTFELVHGAGKLKVTWKFLKWFWGKKNKCANICKLIKQKYIRHTARHNMYIDVDYLDIRDVFKWPSLILSMFASVLRIALVLSFFGLTLAALVTTSENVTNVFNRTITASVFIGWIMTFHWACSFEPVYRVFTALYIMILKDLISWFLFFVFVLLAFASAFYMILQTVPDLNHDMDLPWEHFHFILYDFLLMGCRLPRRIPAEEVTYRMNEAGMNTFPFEFLYTLYAIVTGMFFIGMLNSTMFTTYRAFVKTSKNGWRQKSLERSKSEIGDWLAEKILHPYFFKPLNMVSSAIFQSPNSGHYYITMTKKHRYDYLESFRIMKSSTKEYEWPDMSNDKDSTNNKNDDDIDNSDESKKSPVKKFPEVEIPFRPVLNN